MTKAHVLSLFAPGKMAGAEKVVAVGFNALRRLDEQNNEQNKKSLAIISEKTCPQYAQDFAQVIEDQNSYHLLKSRKIIDLQLLFQLKDLVKKLEIEIIHTHGYKALFYAFFLKIINPLAFKIVHTHHGNTGHTKKVIFYERLACFLMRYCAQVVSLSPIMTNELANFKINKITEISNMFSLPSNTHEMKQPSGASKRFLYLGRLSQEKNPLILLEAFKAVLEKNQQLELHMVGDGPLLKQCIDTYQSDRIYFHGHVSHVTSFIEEADYLCLPSLREGMPMTIIEALCLGRPIIANKVGAVEYMLSPKNSYIIDISHLKEDPEKMLKLWSTTLEEVIKEKDVKEDKRFYAWNNRHHERAKYSIENWVHKTLQMYTKVIGS